MCSLISSILYQLIAISLLKMNIFIECCIIGDNLYYPKTYHALQFSNNYDSPTIAINWMMFFFTIG